MIDVLYPYLCFDQNDPEVRADVDECIKILDKIMLENGWEYTGVHNMYRPVKGTDNEDTWHKAEKAVIGDERLRKYKPYFIHGIWENFCDLDEIIVDGMAPVKEEKMKRYEEFYDRHHSFAHGIVVDENKKLRTGYTTYLIAKEKNARPKVMWANSKHPIRKLVHGRHVTKKGDGSKVAGSKIYTWYCDICDAVVPGDILCVRTKYGKCLMRVEEITYAAGNYDCNQYRRKVCFHTGKNWGDFNMRMLKDLADRE